MDIGSNMNIVLLWAEILKSTCLGNCPLWDVILLWILVLLWILFYCGPKFWAELLKTPFLGYCSVQDVTSIVDIGYITDIVPLWAEVLKSMIRILFFIGYYFYCPA